MSRRKTRTIALGVAALGAMLAAAAGAAVWLQDDDVPQAVEPVTGRGGPSELEVCFARDQAVPVTLWADGPGARMAEADARVGTACGRWTVPQGEYQVGASGPEFRKGCALTVTVDRDGRRIFRATRDETLGTGAQPVNVSADQPTRVLFERRCPA